jgi:hypothetical protein
MLSTVPTFQEPFNDPRPSTLVSNRSGFDALALE